MQPVEVNRHGRIVFPCNFFPDLDFSTLRGIDQFEAVIRRDFDAKAPTGSDILARIQRGGYPDKFELMRDMALNLFWVNRYMITMFNKRPTRWADVPRERDDIYVPILTPWLDGEVKVSAVANAFSTLLARWDETVEWRIFQEPQIPVGRCGRPEEISRVVHFLAMDASSYITGQVWGVNGGLDM